MLMLGEGKSREDELVLPGSHKTFSRVFSTNSALLQCSDSSGP